MTFDLDGGLCGCSFLAILTHPKQLVIQEKVGECPPFLMVDKSSLLKNQGSLYLELIPKHGLFHKMLLLSLMGFLKWLNGPSHQNMYVHFEKHKHDLNIYDCLRPELFCDLYIESFQFLKIGQYLRFQT